jgi:ABC-type nickel/cobalt efflux system permease component RcnA
MLILIYLFSCAFVADVDAHDVPIDQTGHHIQLVIFKDEIIIDYTIVLSEVAYLRTLVTMNIDGREGVSQLEKDSYHSAKREQLLESLELMVDGKPITLTDYELVDDSKAQLFSYKFAAPIVWKSTAKENADVTLRYEISIYSNIELSKGEMLEYYLAADRNIEIVDVKRWDKKDEKSKVSGRGASVTYSVLNKEMGNSPLSEVQKAAGNKKIADEETAVGRLKGFISAPKLSLKLVFVGLIVSAFLGGLHALTPGHGKAVVAAYLVGSKGRIRDAVFLGIIVTMTHTFSVIILGVIVLYASRYILPQDIFPLLGFISGLLIVIIGVWLLIRRLQLYYGLRAEHSHSHPHSHGDEVVSYEVTNCEAHIHSGSDVNNSYYDEHNHTPEIEPKSDVTLWSLLTLGVSGGIVPCPDALIVLLLAVAINRIAFGLAVIGAFSIGLAAVLVTIGILLVVARPIIDRFTGAGRWMRRLPVISAAVIILLGLGIAIKALIDSGIIMINI